MDIHVDTWRSISGYGYHCYPCIHPSLNSSPPQVSIQLVMQYLPLMDLTIAGRVSRLWRESSVSSLVWHHRDDIIQVTLDRPVGSKQGIFASMSELRNEVDAAEFLGSVGQSNLPQLAESRLYRNVRYLQLHILPHFKNKQLQASLRLLDRALPYLKELRVKDLCADHVPTLIAHPLWLRMQSIHITFYEKLSFERSERFFFKPLAINEIQPLHAFPSWVKLIDGLSQCNQLTDLRMRFNDIHYSIEEADLKHLFQSAPHLQSLSLISRLNADNFDFPRSMSSPPIAQLSGLLKMRLPLMFSSQMVQLCESANMLPLLQTLVLSLHSFYRTAEEEAQDRLVKGLLFMRFPTLSELMMQRRQLARLARLPSLRRLTIHDNRCAAGAFEILRFAQQQDSSAFRQLQSFAYICTAPFCVHMVATGTAAAAAEGNVNQSSVVTPQSLSTNSNASVDLLFPSLTSLQLTCCSASWLSAAIDDPDFALVCTQAPNLANLQLKLQVEMETNDMRYDAFAWCRSPALHSLKKLQSLKVERPYWCIDRVKPHMLVDLHALSSLPNLMEVELVCICRLSRVDLMNLLTLDE